MIVSGSAIVKSSNPKLVIDTLKASVVKWIEINSKSV